MSSIHLCSRDNCSLTIKIKTWVHMEIKLLLHGKRGLMFLLWNAFQSHCHVISFVDVSLNFSFILSLCQSLGSKQFSEMKKLYWDHNHLILQFKDGKFEMPADGFIQGVWEVSCPGRKVVIECGFYAISCHWDIQIGKEMGWITGQASCWCISLLCAQAFPFPNLSLLKIW